MIIRRGRGVYFAKKKFKKIQKWTPPPPGGGGVQKIRNTSQPCDKSGNSTYRNQYTPSDFKLYNSNTMHSSIQEFLEETKSIEEDLKRLKQLSVEK